MSNIIKSFIRAKRGVAAIEFAIILPILILLLVGAMEFGIHLLAGQTAQRSIDNITDSIQKNPTDPNLFSVAQNSGLAFAKFNEEPNFFCANSYATLEEAQSGMCEAGQWNTNRPSGVGANAAYYVGIRAYVEPLALGLVSEYLPQVDYESVFQVNVSQGPPTCNGSRQALRYNGSEYYCAEIGSETLDELGRLIGRCDGKQQAVKFDGSKFVCGTVEAKVSGSSGATTPSRPSCKMEGFRISGPIMRSTGSTQRSCQRTADTNPRIKCTDKPVLTGSWNCVCCQK